MKRITAIFSLLLALPISACRSQTPPTPAPNDVPIKHVVLFSSGVGFFQHEGIVNGDATTQLHFKSDQINDILKSLVVQDADGGAIGAINYPSIDPLNKTLSGFDVDLTQNKSLADFLGSVRGATTTVRINGDTLEGTILGVEQRPEASANNEPVNVAFLNVISKTGDIRSVKLESITTLSLNDPRLQEELQKALAAVAVARNQDKKPVTIDFHGNGDRHVRFGYVVQTPVWKTSYRLVLGEKNSTMQGWAIVENQTDNDWQDVQLSLVSGRPISFVMDLYQPRYIDRPTVEPENIGSIRPPVDEGGIAALKVEAAPTQMDAAKLENRPEAGALFSGNRESPPINPVDSIVAAASAEKLGELFQFSIDHVNLARQTSSMLPIVNDPIEAEKISVFNSTVLPHNPLYGVRLKNTTGKHLLAGPITVFEGNGYAGDARISDLPPDQQRLVSYGIDLQVKVDDTKNTQENSILSAKVVKGVLTLSHKHVASREYQSKNSDDKDRTLILEQPIRQGWKLTDTEPPMETTADLYRFKTSVAAGKSAKFTVREQQVQYESITLLQGDSAQINFYVRSGEIPQNVKDALIKASQLKQAVADIDRQIDQHNQQIDAITAEQTRIRSNMNSVDRQSQYYARLMTKLNDQETQIEKLQGEKDDLTQQRESKRGELNDYLNKLNVDGGPATRPASAGK